MTYGPSPMHRPRPVEPISALFALASLMLAVASAVLTADWLLAAACVLIACLALRADLRAATAYRVGWWRARAVTVASLSDAAERHIKLGEWLEHELDREPS